MNSLPTLDPELPRTGIQMSSSSLDAIFIPRSIAVIGASDRVGSVGYTVLRNLLGGRFQGRVVPVNSKHSSILGVKAYPNIRSIEEEIDLAVIITPADTVPDIVSQCTEAGVRGAVIISAGFKEIGPTGVELERLVMENAKKGNMRIIGPNCFGIMNPRIGLNATFAAGIAPIGNVGFITQSGALGSAIIDRSIRENVGYSSFASIGSMVDVNWGDLISYFGNDPDTHSIVIYMESIGDAHSFLAAAKQVALHKPIIVLKPGRTEAASKAAASHTGSLTGSDEVLDAAFKQCGVIRVNEMSTLFSLSELFAKQPRPEGPRLMVLTNAGGPGVLAADALVLGGGKIAEISQDAMKHLNQILPPAWSHGNPVDILGDATPDRYGKALDIIAKDSETDGLLVILAPQAMTSPTEIAKELVPYAQSTGKTILACWIGGDAVTPGIKILNDATIPTFEYPDAAVKMFNYMWKYSYNLRGLQEIRRGVIHPEAESTIAHSEAEKLIQAIRGKERTILTEYESKQLLSLYDIPTVKTVLATTDEEVVMVAETIGYPVVLKLNSETITHKTDVGGVQLNISGADEVRKAFRTIKSSVFEKTKNSQDFQGVAVQPMVKLDGYELIVGSSIDLQFGPILLFGLGGQLVEVFKDSALALPPLTPTLARRMMEQTTIYKALQGVRGRKAIDFDTLEHLLVRFSNLVTSEPWIKEIDINPLLVSSEQIIALDAHIILHGSEMKFENLPKAAMLP
jgi:acetyltransferase